MASHMPGRSWYLLAVGVFILGAALGGRTVVTGIGAIADRLQQVVVPGSAELLLDEPGRYTVFHEHESVVDGRYHSAPERVPGLRVEIVSARNGQPAQLEASTGTVRYELGGRAGVSMLAFHVREPGPHRLTASYDDGRPDPQVVLAVGRGAAAGIFATVLSALALFMGSGAAAMVIAAITYRRRKAHQEAA